MRTDSTTPAEAGTATAASPTPAGSATSADPAGSAGSAGSPARQESGCSLADLAPGTRAEVVDVLGGGAVAVRLTELGFTPGTVVEVVRRAPLRDPVVYRLKDYELCLRRAQAACIRTAVHA